MARWTPRSRDLTLAWVACLLPRLVAVIVLWSQVVLGTSNTVIVDGVFSSDLNTPMWPPLYQVFAEVAWRVTGGWASLYLIAHVAVHASVGTAVLLLSARLGLSRRTAWIGVAVCALLPYLVAASVRQIDVGIFVAVAAWTAAAFARGGASVGWWASAWFLIRPESLAAITGLALWRWGTGATAERRQLWRAVLVFTAVLLTWSGANAWRFGRFTPLPANGGQNLYIGHRPGLAERLADRSFNPPRDPDVPDPAVERGPALYDTDRAAARLALRHIRDDPGGALALVPLKFARYWDWTLGNNPSHSWIEHVLYSVPYLTILFFALAGVARLWVGGQRSALAFLAIVIVGYMLPHLIVFGLIRMRMSVEWALILVGAAALGELRLSPPHAVGSAARLAR